MKAITIYDQVREFHETFGVAIGLDLNNKENLKQVMLRCNLIAEEHQEVQDELLTWDASPMDPLKLTKELADLIYVVVGTAVTFGLPLEEVFNEVHRSNMSKVDDNGNPIYREDGKVMKGPNYRPPDLERFFK